MALPLYLALHSRWKAVCWSSFLGGASQPLGAGVAALWFGIAGKIGGGEVNAGDGREAQGGLIAVTGELFSFQLSLLPSFPPTWRLDLVFPRSCANGMVAKDLLIGFSGYYDVRCATAICASARQVA